ncbi:tyrosine-type recombinase/integrase [Delftia acidovorans]|uniref:tyrosine-type recombinase/integrase n=1 Tax=Delftia acidovorans TaxID=80866 RepID=UPI0028B0565B|nr:hypothetical protein [Delftia acidovorans]
MSTDHIAGGMLHVRQGKTAAKLRIEVTGALQELLAEIQAYKDQLKADTALLLVNEAGQPLTKNMLRNRFDAARDAAGIPKAQFQFRDLRATAATTVDDDGGIRTGTHDGGHDSPVHPPQGGQEGEAREMNCGTRPELRNTGRKSLPRFATSSIAKKKGPVLLRGLVFFGGSCEIRTRDQRIKSQAHKSYKSIGYVSFRQYS